ncbi:protein TolQ [Algiphilus sp. W345]|uniref:Tol-Pal system protein TolQ n=1 Tax=Banduia mediterranea TaxID=3075609 RepID=A0ABU2WMA9_9GAMM|nr:protein TolQ [Algiphilus sp. W345]MDT0498354.1 protein TolQ [Algiphilus sp. W345]
MNAQLSIPYLIGQATVLAKFVLLVLLIASVLSWAMIIGKRALLSRTRKNADRFEERFWSGGNLNDLHEAVRRDKAESGMSAVFQAGYEEFLRQRQNPGVDPSDAVSSIERSLRVAQIREIERLESGLPMLATIGSVSPYVGLFGTVWGIMSAFIAIGNVKQASIAMVAPGIAEALIATAAGLFAAIPAVVAYNAFSTQVERITLRFATFAEELTGILERGLRGGGSAK